MMGLKCIFLDCTRINDPRGTLRDVGQIYNTSFCSMQCPPSFKFVAPPLPMLDYLISGP